MGVLGAIAYLSPFFPWPSGSSDDNPLLSEVRKATLRITVTERGNLESCVTVDGICEVNANQIKIISLVPEGTKVKKGDIVCKFDSSEIDKNLAQQDIKVKQAIAKIETTQQELEIQRNKGESDIIAAKVEMTLAKLDLEKYVEGDFKAETTKQKGEIRLKEKDLKEAKNKLDQFKQLMKKGLKSQEVVIIQESDVAQNELQYESAKLELEVKQKYDYKKKTTEFSSKADQALEEDRAGRGDLEGPDVQGDERVRIGQGDRRYRAAADEGVRQAEGQDRHPRRPGRRRRLRQRRLVRLEPPDPRRRDRLLASARLHASRHDQDAGEAQHPRIA